MGAPARSSQEGPVGACPAPSAERAARPRALAATPRSACKQSRGAFRRVSAALLEHALVDAVRAFCPRCWSQSSSRRPWRTLRPPRLSRLRSRPQASRTESPCRPSGSVELGTPGEQVIIERAEGETWLEEARGPTDAAGSFRVDLPALRGGFYRARAEVSGAVSEPVLLEVLPRIRVTVARGRAFVGARLTARIRPTSYTGNVSIAVRDRGRVVATASARVRDGRLSTTVPVPGLGPFVAVLTRPRGGRTGGAHVLRPGAGHGARPLGRRERRRRTRSRARSSPG